MKIKTINGELVKITKNELIYNALKEMAYLCSPDDEVYLALAPRRDGIRVYRNDLKEVIKKYMTQYTK